MSKQHKQDTLKYNLLIIGNGFDIKSGLDSRYTDFFNSYDKESGDKCVSYANKQVKNIYSQFFTNYPKFKRLLRGSLAYKWINDKKLCKCCKNVLNTIVFGSIPELPKYMSFFFLYFALLNNDKFNLQYNSLYNWSDIENQLYILLSKYSPLIVKTLKNLYIKHPYIPGIIDNLKVDIKKQCKNNMKNKVINRTNFDYFVNKTLVIVIMSIKFLQIMGINDKCNFYDFLYNQLHIFENDFGYYINIEETSTDNYISNVKRIIKFIKKSNGNKQKILSFNYTDLVPTVGRDNIRNVHSTFQYNPIIGIDSSRNNAYKQPYYMFTKTYRTLNLINDNSNNIYKDEYTTNILPSKKTIRRIIFYGHSLGIEDYSYFMAIFDYYHIYDSKVQLIFYYNNHDGKDESRSQYISIFELINHYGSCIHHGENLLHKLILENRIHIKYLHVKTIC